MEDPRNYTRQKDDIYQRTVAFVKSCMKEVDVSKVENEGGEELDVFAIFGTTIFDAVETALMDFYPVDIYSPEIHDGIEEAKGYMEQAAAESPDA